MPEKKKQHYVPQFYMRQFANNNGKFSIYHIKNEKCVEEVPYNNQCYKDYYYGNDGIWEERLSAMETKWAIVIKKILANDILVEEDFQLIKQFALYQRQRTYAEGEYVKQGRKEILIECGKMLYANKGWLFDDEAKRICEERATEEVTPAENLENAVNLTKYLEDLSVLIINYKTNRELVSSDTPVIIINPFHKYTIGYGCMGIVLFFPVSRHKLAVIYDSKIYSRFKNNQYTDIYDESEVYNLNAFQYISAEKILFAHGKNEFLNWGDDVKVARSNCREGNAISTLGPEGNRIIMSGQRLVLYDCELSFGQLPHRFKRIPFTCREAVPRKWEMEWESKLNLKEQIMMEVFKMNPKSLADIGLSKKDLKRGYRRMALAAHNYWNEDIVR